MAMWAAANSTVQENVSVAVLLPAVPERLPSGRPAVRCENSRGDGEEGQPPPLQLTGALAAQFSPLTGVSVTMAPVTESGPLLVTVRV